MQAGEQKGINVHSNPVYQCPLKDILVRFKGPLPALNIGILHFNEHQGYEDIAKRRDKGAGGERATGKAGTRMQTHTSTHDCTLTHTHSKKFTTPTHLHKKRKRIALVKY